MILVFFVGGGHLAFDPKEWSVEAIVELLEGREITRIEFLEKLLEEENSEQVLMVA